MIRALGVARGGGHGSAPDVRVRLPRMASAASRERYARKNEAEDLRRAFAFLDSKSDGAIDAEELGAALVALGHRPKRGEVRGARSHVHAARPRGAAIRRPGVAA